MEYSIHPKKISATYDPSQMKMTNKHFWQIFFNDKFLCVKIVANKKIRGDILTEN